MGSPLHWRPSCSTPASSSSRNCSNAAHASFTSSSETWGSGSSGNTRSSRLLGHPAVDQSLPGLCGISLSSGSSVAGGASVPRSFLRGMKDLALHLSKLISLSAEDRVPRTRREDPSPGKPPRASGGSRLTDAQPSPSNCSASLADDAASGADSLPHTKAVAPHSSPHLQPPAAAVRSHSCASNRSAVSWVSEKLSEAASGERAAVVKVCLFP